VGRFEYFPIVTAQGSAIRTRNSAFAFGSEVPVESRIATFYDAGLDATWELDFFGRVRRANEALSAEYEAQVFQQRFVAVTVAAEVARTYVELRGAQLRLQVARLNADNQRQTYDLTVALLEGGRGTELDLARAQAQLESTLATIPPLETEVARAEHRLAVLTGRPPGGLRGVLSDPDPASMLPEQPELVGVGDPAALLRRRPDIHAAEAQLAAATARIGVNVADLFPRVTLIGSGGYLATDLDELGSDRSERFEVGPVISWAAFDLGRVRALIRASEASADAELASYEQVVLQALEETENALVRYGRARDTRLRAATWPPSARRNSVSAQFAWRKTPPSAAPA
jgi:multidrug efflux system outer membrane protein